MKSPKLALKRAIERYARAVANSSWRGQYPPGHEARIEIDHEHIMAKRNLDRLLATLRIECDDTR